MAKMSLQLLNNVQHWQDRAEEARIHAEQVTDSEAKRMMLEIAISYDELAARAKERRLMDEGRKIE
jgi:hypothetical protein